MKIAVLRSAQTRDRCQDYDVFCFVGVADGELSHNYARLIRLAVRKWRRWWLCASHSDPTCQSHISALCIMLGLNTHMKTRQGGCGFNAVRCPYVLQLSAERMTKCASPWPVSGFRIMMRCCYCCEHKRSVNYLAILQKNRSLEMFKTCVCHAS